MSDRGQRARLVGQGWAHPDPKARRLLHEVRREVGPPRRRRPAWVRWTAALALAAAAATVLAHAAECRGGGL